MNNKSLDQLKKEYACFNIYTIIYSIAFLVCCITCSFIWFGFGGVFFVLSVIAGFMLTSSAQLSKERERAIKEIEMETEEIKTEKGTHP